MKEKNKKELCLNKNTDLISYQDFFDDTQSHLSQLKKYKRWTIGCLIFGWMIIFCIKFLKLPLAHNPYFPSAIFFPLLLLGTKNLEEELALDKKIIENTLIGIKREYGLKNSAFFSDFAKSHDGVQLFGYVFTRISPTLMILFAALNTGLVITMIFGILMGLAALFLGRFIYFPYQRLQNISSAKSF